MIAKKYHAIAFLSILVMLLLLGLQLLGFGLSGAVRPSAAGLARQPSASSSNQQVYRHPISYDKLTGATNKISEVLGAPPMSPIRSHPQAPLMHQPHHQQLARPLLVPMGGGPPSAASMSSALPPMSAPMPPPPSHATHSAPPPPLNMPLIAPLMAPLANVEPMCARLSNSGSQSGGAANGQQTQQQQATPPEMANSSTQMPVLFCNEDSDYPTGEIMRALETYAMSSSIEQLLPQQLVQLLLVASANSATNSNNNGPAKANSGNQLEFQRQLVMDPLQANVNAASAPMPRMYQEPSGVWFPSGNYEPMCRAASYIAQPRRAKNLLGQWKLIVNLPGHKYRGVAVSQMVRVEECTRPNSECAGGNLLNIPGQTTNTATTTMTTTTTTTTANNGNKAQGALARSRCLQHYENQRLLAWSHQQGLHMDLFRLPSACSCHIRRL